MPLTAYRIRILFAGYRPRSLRFFGDEADQEIAITAVARMNDVTVAHRLAVGTDKPDFEKLRPDHHDQRQPGFHAAHRDLDPTDVRSAGYAAGRQTVALFPLGHLPPINETARETLDWLDKYLGPVRR